MKTYYFTPAHREFANACDFAYQRECSDAAAAAIAEKFGCHLTADPGWIERLQCRMHKSGGCTHSVCTCDKDFQEYDEDGEYIRNCGFTIIPAEEFCDTLPIEWIEWAEENERDED